MNNIPTSIFRIDPDDLDAHLIALAADVLRAGGLVAFPTETVYGLGGVATDERAVARIFEAKGRPATDPLIVHINTPSQFQIVAREIPKIAHDLADAFWPGPLTLVVKKQPAIPDAVTAGRDTVAVRMPAHPIALELLDALDLPIAAPSANRFGHTSPTTAQHVLDDLSGLVDVIFDGGHTRIGLESTVIDVSGDVPRLLRPGGIALEQLQPLLPDLYYEPQMTRPEDAAASPGTLAKHYAPRAEMRLYSGEAAAMIDAMEAACRDLLAEGKRVGVLLPDQEAGRFMDERVAVATMGDTPEQIGANLYRAMRQLDDAGVDVILAHGFTRAGLGLAIWDRLLRAAEGKVIEVEG